MKDRDQILKLARYARLQSRYDEAKAIYEQILSEGPDDPDALRGYGRTLYSMFQDLEKASHFFERSLEIEPDSLISLLYLGELYSLGYGKGYGAALPLYQRIIDLHPSQTDVLMEAYISIGMLLDSPGSPITLKEAISAYRKATEIDPQRADAHNNLGMVLLQAGDRETALQELKTAEQLFIKDFGESTPSLQKNLATLENNTQILEISGSYMCFSLINKEAFHKTIDLDTYFTNGLDSKVSQVKGRPS